MIIMTKQEIAISEDFYSIQGEGITMGMPSLFVRLGGCNLLCGGAGTQKDKMLHNGATWRCDSIEEWQEACGNDISEAGALVKALQRALKG